MGLDDATLRNLAEAGNLLHQRVPLSDEQKAWLETTQRNYPQFFAVPAASEAARAAASANPMIPLDHHAIPLKVAYAKELMGKLAAANSEPLTDEEEGWYAVASGQLDIIRDSSTVTSDAGRDGGGSRGATTSGPAPSQLSLPADQGALTPHRRALLRTDMERQWGRAQDESSIPSTPSGRYSLPGAVHHHHQQQQQPLEPVSNRPLHEPDSSPAPARRNRRSFTRPVNAQQHVAPSGRQPLSPSPMLIRPPRPTTPVGGLRQFPIHPPPPPPPPPPPTTPAVWPVPQAAPLASLSPGPSSADMIRQYEEYSRQHRELQPMALKYAELDGLMRKLELELLSKMAFDGEGEA